MTRKTIGKAARLLGVILPTAAVMVLTTVEIADARGVRGGGGGSVRGGGGGGFRGGGGGGGGYRGGGGARSYGGGGYGGRTASASRPGAGGAGTYRGYSSGATTRPGAGGAGTRNTVANRGDRTNVNRGNNRGNNNRWNNGNINVGNDIDVDVDNGWNGCCGGDWDYHPVAAGVAFGTAAAITSAAVGSYVYSLPPSCAPSPYNGYTYYNCSGTWYQPAYQGSSVTYTVVSAPY
jgi:hypothetical protein